MEDVLINPVYNALLSGDAHLSCGNDKVKFFEKDMSPFAGFDENYPNGFEDLRRLLPAGRRILYAIPKQIETPRGWKLLENIPGLQFVLGNYTPEDKYAPEIVSLGPANVQEMITLTSLTKPGPFNHRTIEFGSYYGIFQNNRLAAMTGQRLHIFNYTEISAVCTHPGFLGKGFAAALLHHQVDLILAMKQIPILHVRADNTRAIELYERIGFKKSRSMNFYILKKE